MKNNFWKKITREKRRDIENTACMEKRTQRRKRGQGEDEEDRKMTKILKT